MCASCGQVPASELKAGARLGGLRFSGPHGKPVPPPAADPAFAVPGQAVGPLLGRFKVGLPPMWIDLFGHVGVLPVAEEYGDHGSLFCSRLHLTASCGRWLKGRPPSLPGWAT